MEEYFSFVVTLFPLYVHSPKNNLNADAFAFPAAVPILEVCIHGHFDFSLTFLYPFCSFS
jgi:hypothetical protein